MPTDPGARRGPADPRLGRATAAAGRGWAAPKAAVLRAAASWWRSASPTAIRLLLSCAGLALDASPAGPAPVEDGDLVVVVYNKRLPESKDVADHYARARRVPSSQVVGFDLPTTETMTRADFRRLLQQPLYDYLVLRGVFILGPAERAPDGVSERPRVVRSGVRYLVSCYGVPVRIAHDDTLAEENTDKVLPELRRNGAAVDSELACLPLGRQSVRLTGPMLNPFYGATNLGRLQVTNGILLAARLDGPSAALARGLVDKAMDAEKYGLWGRAYFDTRGLTNGPYMLGEEWLRGAAFLARQAGYETILDDSGATFADTFPMSHIALYAGWYDGHVSGPFARPDVEFMPGAFAYHLHSFSAATVRSATQHWVGPLVAKGATATVGYVDEPYLSTTCDVARLLHGLLHMGASFGEAVYAASRTLSWQMTVVGDPLYRPCAVPADLRHYHLELRLSRLVEWSHVQVVNRNLIFGAPPGDLIAYLEGIPFTRHSAVLTEKMAELFRLQKNLPAAVEALQNALDRFPSPQQRVRLLTSLAETQVALGRERDAARTWQRFLKECPGYPKPLEVWQHLLSLARKLNDGALVEECQAQIQRLSPPPAAPSNAPPAR